MTDDERDLDTFVSETLQALGEANPQIVGVLQVSPSRWAIGLEDCQVEIDLNESGLRLVLSTRLPEQPRDRLEQLMPQLLAYNLMWRDSGAVHTALADTSIFLITDAPLAGLTAESLTMAFSPLLHARTRWLDRLNQPQAETPPLQDHTIFRA